MLFWVCDFTVNEKWPCLDYFTAKRWFCYLTEIKGHECEIDNPFTH